MRLSERELNEIYQSGEEGGDFEKRAPFSTTATEPPGLSCSPSLVKFRFLSIHLYFVKVQHSEMGSTTLPEQAADLARSKK